MLAQLALNPSGKEKNYNYELLGGKHQVLYLSESRCEIWTNIYKVLIELIDNVMFVGVGFSIIA